MLHIPNQKVPVLGANHYERRGPEVSHSQPGKASPEEQAIFCGRAVLWLGGPAAGGVWLGRAPGASRPVTPERPAATALTGPPEAGGGGGGRGWGGRAGRVGPCPHHATSVADQGQTLGVFLALRLR